MNDDRPLHIRQAEGLRQLADVIEKNPELAHMLRYGLENFGSPVADQARETLTEFHRLMRAGGKTPKVYNDITMCEVSTQFGPVGVRLYATAEHMAGERSQPEYTPLEVGER